MSKRNILVSITILVAINFVVTTQGQTTLCSNDSQNIQTTKKANSKSPEIFTMANICESSFDGIYGRYLKNITSNWLMGITDRNPMILEMYTEQSREAKKDLLPWSGEFAGKYLTGAVQILSVTKDERLKEYILKFTGELISAQADNGYLGPWPKEYELTGRCPIGSLGEATWDTWGHYHVMLGLMLWYEYTGDVKALNAAKKIGDLLCDTFYQKSLVEIGSPTMNISPAHSLCILYRLCGDEKYLKLAQRIVEREFADQNAGNWLNNALCGKEYYQSKLPRWEALHPIMAMAELYWITSQTKYRDAFEQIWWSIVKLDRHNTGGFSTSEEAKGDPYMSGAIETCCTIAWAAMSVEMLKMTGNSIVADELELTLYNGIFGYENSDGSMCTYNTPMDGQRIPSTTDISFQIRPGSEQLNCCSANSARGFGLASEWALMKEKEDSLILNWYGPSQVKAMVGDTSVMLSQNTDYPRTGKVVIVIEPEKTKEFTLKLRIPNWSENTAVKLNGTAIDSTIPGSYLALRRQWQKGDTIELDLDMSLHYWAGQKEKEGFTSIYRGPILLAYNTNTKQKFSEHWRSGGGMYVTDQKGAEATFEFDGNSVVLIGKRYDDAGIIAAEIDGKTVGEIDEYGPVRDCPFEWSYQEAGSGTHVLKLVVTGEKNTNSKGVWCNSGGLKGATIKFDAQNMDFQLLDADSESIVRLKFKDIHGEDVVLRDFDSAGDDGRSYESWLKVENVKSVNFTKNNPLRSVAK